MFARRTESADFRADRDVVSGDLAQYIKRILVAVLSFQARCKYYDTPSPSLNQPVHRRQIRHRSLRNTETAYFPLLGPT